MFGSWIRSLHHTLALFATAFALGSPVDAAVSVLHAFDGAGGGSRPLAPVTLANGTLFGVTSEGGVAGTGTLFRVGDDGAGFQTLHDFDALADPAGEGSFPNGPLTAIGGDLYGVTEFGGAAFDGVVYRIRQNGTGYTPIHEFDMNTDPAVSPSGGVFIDGGALFGATLFGSTVSEGSIYTVEPDGSGFDVLHTFAGDGSQGEEIEGPLALAGQHLWGVAVAGGAFDGGTIFRLAPDGSGFAVAHEFGDGADGATPVGGLLPSSGKLIGLTRGGGDFGDGTLYAINDDGSGYAKLFDFQDAADGGAAPTGGLLEIDGRLFGVTDDGGPSGLGTVFSIGADGSGFRLHHAFSGVDGASPQGGLTYDGTTLYGVTAAGGSSDAGVLFALDPNALTGDFNADGRVDAADYTVWRDTEGSATDLRADGDFNGVIEQADYAVWAANYGRSTAAELSVAVPEPGSLWIVAGASFVGRRRLAQPAR